MELCKLKNGVRLNSKSTNFSLTPKSSSFITGRKISSIGDRFQNVKRPMIASSIYGNRSLKKAFNTENVHRILSRSATPSFAHGTRFASDDETYYSPLEREKEPSYLALNIGLVLLGLGIQGALFYYYFDSEKNIDYYSHSVQQLEQSSFPCEAHSLAASQHEPLMKAGLFDKVIQAIQNYKYWDEEAQATCFTILNNLLAAPHKEQPQELEYVLKNLDITKLIEDSSNPAADLGLETLTIIAEHEKGRAALASKKDISHRFVTQVAQKDNPVIYRFLNLYLLAQLSRSAAGLEELNRNAVLIIRELDNIAHHEPRHLSTGILFNGFAHYAHFTLHNLAQAIRTRPVSMSDKDWTTLQSYKPKQVSMTYATKCDIEDLSYTVLLASGWGALRTYYHLPASIPPLLRSSYVGNGLVSAVVGVGIFWALCGGLPQYIAKQKAKSANRVDSFYISAGTAWLMGAAIVVIPQHFKYCLVPLIPAMYKGTINPFTSYPHDSI